MMDGPKAKARGYFTKPELQTLCHWKSPRTAARVAENDPSFIKEVTRASLSSSHERYQIEVLTLLTGVQWPTASVILHFAAREPYPFLDFRALWSLGIPTAPAYDYLLWSAYTRFCRTLSRKVRVTMRTLDRALWQYSKKHQG